MADGPSLCAYEQRPVFLPHQRGFLRLAAWPHLRHVSPAWGGQTPGMGVDVAASLRLRSRLAGREHRQ